MTASFSDRLADVRSMRRAAFDARIASLPSDSSTCTEAEWNEMTERANADYIAAMAIVDARQAELDAECAAQPEQQGWVFGNE